MNSKSDKRRRVYYYSLPVQLKYTVILSLIAGFLSLIMIVVMAWFIQRNYNLFLGDELGISSQMVEVVRREQTFLEWSLFILFLATVATMFLSAFYIINKLTGPVVALQRQLEVFSQGDWSRVVKLRKNDEFKEFEILLNQIRQQFLETSAQKHPLKHNPAALQSSSS